MSSCQTCKGLESQKLGARLALEFAPGQLQDSALTKGCHLCSVLLQGILVMQDETWSFMTDVSIVNGYALANVTLFLEIYFIGKKPRLVIEFFNPAADQKAIPLKAFQPRSSPIDDPLSEQALEWVNARMEECQNTHTCLSAQPSLLPDRILSFVGSPGGDITAKIVEPRNVQARYATLSHRWGPAAQFTSTIANLGSRKQVLPWMELPKLYQDAMRFCLKLNINYLWVDALCILQDDAKDWETQSAKMAHIFQGSCITLAATWSDGTTDGCFPPRPTANVEHKLRVEIPNRNMDTYTLKVRRRIPHWSTNSSRLPMQDSPLLHRAWVFQERVLSPRVLHFRQHEMIWECGQDIICECSGLSDIQNFKTQFALSAELVAEARELNVRRRSSPSNERAMSRVDDFDEFNDQVDARREALRQVFDIGKRMFDMDISRAYEPIRQWHDIVEHFSQLSLTKFTDRLPALSGLAVRMAPFLGTYAAGLWHSSLLHDMAWKVTDFPRVLHQPRGYRGPSWSWVAVNAGVSFMDTSEQTQRSLPGQEPSGGSSCRPPNTSYKAPNIISIQVDKKGENPYGTVSSAALITQGLFRSVDLIRGPNPSNRLEIDIKLSSRSASIVPSFRVPLLADLRDDNMYDTQLFLFALFPRICLVLVATGLHARGTKIYKRVGIIELAEQIEQLYQIDWLDGAEYIRIIIV